MRLSFFLLGLIGALLMVQAAPAQEQPQTLLGADDLADQLTISLRGANALKGRRLAVLPFVSLDDLQTVSRLGRVVGEELASALHFRNYHLAEIRGDDQILFSRQVGELFLTRTGPDRQDPSQTASLQELVERYNLGGVVVGTYTALWDKDPLPGRGREGRFVGGEVALNARLVEPLSGAVLAVGTIKIELTPQVAILLHQRRSALPPVVAVIKQKRF